jgi:hypothetical protein
MLLYSLCGTSTAINKHQEEEAPTSSSSYSVGIVQLTKATKLDQETSNFPFYLSTRSTKTSPSLQNTNKVSGID